MSTILKALRRLEEDERRKSETQEWVSDTPASASSRRRLPVLAIWLLGALAVLIGAGLGVGLRGWWVEESPASLPPVAESRIVLPPVEEELVVARVERIVEPERVEPQASDANSIPHVVSRESGGTPVTRRPIETASARGSVLAAKEVPNALPPARAAATPAVSKPTPVAAVVDSSKTPVAPGPSRPVEALPLAQVSKPLASAPVAPKAASERPTNLPSTQSESPPVKVASVAVVAEKPSIPSAPRNSPPPDPGPVKASASRVSASAAASVPDSLKVTVLSTTWHPSREKRSASLSEEGVPSDRSFVEGDSWMGWKVVEIKLSGVSFEREGVRVERKVGSAPR